jgi:REP element-mobilizing transposase RayT
LTLYLRSHKFQKMKKTRKPQLEMLAKKPSAYGGELLKKRRGRMTGRPLSTKYSMHLVLRSSIAVGEKSFLKPIHRKAIQTIVKKFSVKYGIKILSLANVGNHLHFHIRLGNRLAYRAFIRAVTAAIAMAVNGVSRWSNHMKAKFWDYRPYTCVVEAYRQLLNLKDYIQVNKYEGLGYSRTTARYFINKGIIPNTA